jgi:hypothetical protein
MVPPPFSSQAGVSTLAPQCGGLPGWVQVEECAGCVALFYLIQPISTILPHHAYFVKF